MTSTEGTGQPFEKRKLKLNPLYHSCHPIKFQIDGGSGEEPGPEENTGQKTEP